MGERGDRDRYGRGVMEKNPSLLAFASMLVFAAMIGVCVWTIYEHWWMGRVQDAVADCTGSTNVSECICPKLAEFPPVRMSYCTAEPVELPK